MRIDIRQLKVYMKFLMIAIKMRLLQPYQSIRKVETAGSVIYRINDIIEEIFLIDLKEKSDEKGIDEKDFCRLKEISVEGS